MSLLQVAEPVATRLKCYIYGETGTGKTITALSFPNVALVDAEDGSIHYGKFKKFHRIRTSDPIVVKATIDELLDNPQGIKTFVIDPFTTIYESILNKHENRMKVKTGNPNYLLQPTDYKAIKSEVKSLILKLLSLDMNVIVTARSSTEYAKEGFMQAIGTKPDGPKELP